MLDDGPSGHDIIFFASIKREEVAARYIIALLPRLGGIFGGEFGTCKRRKAGIPREIEEQAVGTTDIEERARGVGECNERDCPQHVRIVDAFVRFVTNVRLAIGLLFEIRLAIPVAPVFWICIDECEVATRAMQHPAVVGALPVAR